jgi:hypothetical protein
MSEKKEFSKRIAVYTVNNFRIIGLLEYEDKEIMTLRGCTCDKFTPGEDRKIEECECCVVIDIYKNNIIFQEKYLTDDYPSAILKDGVKWG